MPSKRAETHAVASTAGANHAKSHPDISAAARVRGESSFSSCHASNATSAAHAACSTTLIRCQPKGSAPSNVFNAKLAIVSGRY